MQDPAATASPQVRRNPVRRRFDEGEIALGAWANLADPALVEIIGVAGFDAVGINLEHVTFGLDVTRQMIIAADAVGIAPIVRVPAGDWDTALRVLDAGAQGIQVSHVTDVATARAAVDAVKFAPVGRRGALGHARAARYGTIPWKEFRQAANEEILLMLMIEDSEAIEHVAEIAALDGVDLVMVGAGDLSVSVGATGPDDPRLRAAFADVAEQIRSVGRAQMGFTLGHTFLPLSLNELREFGVVYANVSPQPDILLLQVLTDVVKRTRAEWHEA